MNICTQGGLCELEVNIKGIFRNCGEDSRLPEHAESLNSLDAGDRIRDTVIDEERQCQTATENPQISERTNFVSLGRVLTSQRR